MSARLFVGEARIEDRTDAVLAEGRGVAYGDGIFETMRAIGGSIPWWPGHRARLALGAARLRIVLPSPECLDSELHDWLSLHRDAVIKLIVTRGSGGRGYTPMLQAPPVWMLIASSLPPPLRPGGLVLRWCDTRLSRQPLLAGIKHCNRLEQILARAEWSDTGIDEGLMRDTEGDVVAATAANLFVLREGHWWTPPLDHCGIAGVCRSWALRAFAAGERRLTAEEVETADAVVLSNAVRGILPVARLGDRVWAPHPAVGDARRRLAAAHPAFAYPAFHNASNEDAP
ncbi:MAG: aminodeoxychorismate lyase [Xanthomonadales bacterium]|nr:aminodeoxychorismate lyase [Xanthomonadales bacterium]